MTTFKETQKIRQWWVWTLMLGGAVIMIWQLLQLVDSGQTTKESLLSPGFVIAGIGLGLAILILYLLTLTTEVSSEGIRIKYFPLWSTRIRWDDVQTAEIIQYGFVGYGIRLSFRYGVVYNAEGDMGLQIVKKNGNKVLVGTQRPDELEAVIKEFMRKDTP